MPTTYTANFKNAFVNCLTGRTSSVLLTHIRPCDGVQPADPNGTPAGVFAFNSVPASINVSGFMSSPGLGVSQLGAPRSAPAISTTTTLNWARIYDSSQNPCVDVTAGTSGSVGIILDSPSATASTNLTITGYSFKVPQSAGTVFLNTDLVNALAAAFCNNIANIGVFTSSTMIVYSGTPPASADAPLSGNTVLATYTFSATSPWGSAIAGAAILTANQSVNASATGTATFARVTKGAYVLQGTVGTSSSDFIVDTTAAVSGSPFVLNEATISF